MKNVKTMSVFISIVFWGLTISTIAQTSAVKAMQSGKTFLFAELPYSYDALEPYIDKLTVEIHYSKHHRAYFDNFIKAVKGTEMEQMDMVTIFNHISQYPIAIRNNGGGYYNHTMYWENMKPNGGGLPSGKLLLAINKAFNSVDNFKLLFTNASKTRFGSGWAWLSLNDKNELFISSTANQDNPLMDVVEERGIPLIAFDVWEHAYYLKYQNKRAEYIDAFWNLINWDEVTKRYEKATMKMSH